MLYILIAGLLGLMYYMLKPRRIKVSTKGEVYSTKLWNFNQNTWHARYYKWLLSTGNLPSGGCVYFWTLFGMSICLIIFFPIILLAWLIIAIICKKKHKLLSDDEWKKELDKINRKEKRSEKIGKIASVIGKILLGTGLLFSLVVLIYGCATTPTLWWHLLIFLGFIIAVTSIVILILWLWVDNNIGRKIKNSKLIRYSHSLISGWFDRTCPRISWSKTFKNEEQEEEN